MSDDFEEKRFSRTCNNVGDKSLKKVDILD